MPEQSAGKRIKMASLKINETEEEKEASEILQSLAKFKISEAIKSDNRRP